MKKVISIVLFVGAAYGAYHVAKDLKGWWTKRKAAKAPAPAPAK